MASVSPYRGRYALSDHSGISGFTWYSYQPAASLFDEPEPVTKIRQSKVIVRLINPYASPKVQRSQNSNKITSATFDGKKANQIGVSLVQPNSEVFKKLDSFETASVWIKEEKGICL